MRSDDADFEEIRKSFLAGVPEAIESIENEILHIERGVDKDSFTKRCRKAMSQLHSLKGASGAHEFQFISKNCHQMEDQLVALTLEPEKIEKHNFSELLKQLDSLRDFSNKYLQKNGEIRESDFQINSTPPQAEKKQIPVSVLIIESSNVIVKTFSRPLQELGCKIAVCRTNIEGLQRILDGEKYDLVLFSQIQSGVKGTTLAAVLKLEMGSDRPKTLLISSSTISTSNPGLAPDYTLNKGPTLFSETAKIISQLQTEKAKNAKSS